MKSGKLFLSFITSKVFELQGCATAQIVDRFKSFKKSIFDDANGRYDAVQDQGQFGLHLFFFVIKTLIDAH